MNMLRILIRPQLLVVYAFALTTFLGMVAINALAPRAEQTSAASLAPVGDLASFTIKLDALQISLDVPTNWSTPVALDAHRLLVSEAGSADTTTTAAPFLLVVLDALNVFKRQLAFRDDYNDPTQQLDALVSALNRTAARFSPADVYVGANYPAAITRGFERGNELTIILLNAGEYGWVYIGAQANEGEFDYYAQNVFEPASRSLLLH